MKVRDRIQIVETFEIEGKPYIGKTGYITAFIKTRRDVLAVIALDEDDGVPHEDTFDIWYMNEQCTIHASKFYKEVILKKCLLFLASEDFLILPNWKQVNINFKLPKI